MICFILLVLEIEFRALHILFVCSTTELNLLLPKIYLKQMSQAYCDLLLDL